MTLSPVFETASGKPCKTSATVVMCEHHTGIVRAYDRHEAHQPNSQAQITQRESFANIGKTASKWWKVNNPQKGAPKSSWTADFRRLDEAFQSQKKYNSRWALLCSCVQKDGSIVLNGTPFTNFVPDQEGLG